ncbi:hypothetical protein FPV67DRAFT_1649674 [Lyophyllum atratum]|nr:hypothetical protein FPV67DRAFT_1649674 [Lyophyllum atratum]
MSLPTQASGSDSHSSSLQLTDLPALFSTYDHGGGVLSQSTSTFIIYTTTTLPPSLHPLLTSPPPALSELATTVANHIPIHLAPSTSDLTRDLKALPAPIGSASREIDRLPWFFLNAATSSQHAIAGRGSPLETLLAVLLRPWCALELCCVASGGALRALLGFVRCVAELRLEGYGAAEMLLTHELEWRDREEEREQGHVRRGREGGEWFRSTPTTLRMGQRMRGTRRPLYDVRDMYAALFSGSMRSYNGFWLRLICVAGLELGVGYSRLGLLLSRGAAGGGDGGEPLAVYSRARGGSMAGRVPYRTLYWEGGCEGEWGSRSASNLEELLSGIESGGDGDGSAIRDRRKCRGVVSTEFILLVYAQALQRLGGS